MKTHEKPRRAASFASFSSLVKKRRQGGYKNLLSLKTKRGDSVPPLKKVKLQKLMTNNYKLTTKRTWENMFYFYPLTNENL
jgi:hypothetical protein